MTYTSELYPTIITPYHEDNTIDFEGLGKLIRLFSKNDCDGIFAVCQSSEMFYLSEEEKLALAAFSIAECRKTGIKCVVSGHTQDCMDAQLSYLKKLELLNPDAIVLVSNRLAAENEGDEVLLEKLNTILENLKPSTRLGMYECPYPYKRLLSNEVVEYISKTGRFDFIKDTCCHIETIRERLRILKGSCTGLYNANAGTLFESILAGAAGYSGIMLNSIPEVFALLKGYITGVGGDTGRTDLQAAGEIADFISMSSVFEYQNYPVNAKYILCSRGVIHTALTRTGKPPMTETQQKEALSLMKVAFKLCAK